MAKNAIDHGVRRCHTAAMGPRARQQSTQQSTYIICDRAASVNLEKILIITINMTIIARRVVDDVRRRRIDDKTMGIAWRPLLCN
jgi:hypothetical protein